jgi:Mg2+ and Co2+ transporter CorA
MTALPSWIDQEAWNGYVDMRRAMKKPMTARAETLVLKTLYLLRERGHDPNAALDQSSVHNWIDVYEPKAKEVTNLVKTYYEPEVFTEEQRKASAEAKAKVMGMVNSVIRRVA